jgi:PAS domain-containing protein
MVWWFYMFSIFHYLGKLTRAYIVAYSKYTAQSAISPADRREFSMGKKTRSVFLRIGMMLALLLFPAMESFAASGEAAHTHDIGHFVVLLAAVVPTTVTAVVLICILLRTRRRHRDQLQALHNAQESFTALVDENPNIAIMFDAKLRFIDCNRAFMDIYGFATKEDALANFYTAVPPSILPVQKTADRRYPSPSG